MFGTVQAQLLSLPFVHALSHGFTLFLALRSKSSSVTRSYPSV